MSSLDNLRTAARRWLKALRANDQRARDRLVRAIPDAPRRRRWLGQKSEAIGISLEICVPPARGDSAAASMRPGHPAPEVGIHNVNHRIIQEEG